MENRRFILIALFVVVLFFLYQAWQDDYGNDNVVASNPTPQLNVPDEAQTRPVRDVPDDAPTAALPADQGDAPTASTVLAESMGALRAELGDDAPLASSLALVRAKAAHLQGLDEEAETLLLSALTSAQVHGYLDILACGLEVAVSLWMGTAQERARMAQITHLANGYPPD